MERFLESEDAAEERRRLREEKGVAEGSDDDDDGDNIDYFGVEDDEDEEGGGEEDERQGRARYSDYFGGERNTNNELLISDILCTGFGQPKLTICKRAIVQYRVRQQVIKYV